MNRHLKLLVCLCGAAAFAADGENAAPADELAARRLEAAIPLAPRTGSPPFIRKASTSLRRSIRLISWRGQRSKWTKYAP